MAELRVPKGAVKKKRSIGRGNGSKGGTSGRGSNGQNARSGGGVRPGFEGGQMPLYRRIARRGFSNFPFKKEYQIVSLCDINDRFAAESKVNFGTLKEKGLVSGKGGLVKILANGEVDKKFIVNVDKISGTARTKIEAVGGKIIEKEGSHG